MERCDILHYVTGISHFAVVVTDIDLAVKQYALLGFVEDSVDVIEEKNFGVQAKIIRNGTYVLELMAPLNECSQLSTKITVNKYYALDHICFEVSDMDAQIALLKKNRFNITAQKRISDIWNRNVVLLGNRSMGIIELIEQY